MMPITREPYDGPVSSEAEVTPDRIRSDNPIMPAHPDSFYQHSSSKDGVRNQQQSSFSLSGKYKKKSIQIKTLFTMIDPYLL